ncbi:MAG: inner membrane CreD family protein [Candidatus Eremiobacteraeota bacterium]|nr:inner membrane CreD family protein [Candidatus Eremiobacteraeota bacterium]
MVKRLVAIGLISCGAAFAWDILGGTLGQRTADSDSNQRERLNAQWGTPQAQRAPEVSSASIVVPLQSSRVNVHLDLEQRRKGLLWYNLYQVRFDAHYVVRNTTANQHLTMRFSLPKGDGSYTDVSYRIGNRQIDAATALDQSEVPFELQPGATTSIDVAYSSRGTDSWIYWFSNGTQSVKDFDLVMTTNFSAVDFPPKTLLPVSEHASNGGWRGDWRYSALVTTNGIGLVVPFPLQPGPLAQRITFWAPVALLFYFFVMLLMTTLRRVELHPMNYFFLACAFFAFHLLFAYLVDRVALIPAFIICSMVSIFLTVTYLRLVAGWRFAAVESGIAQLVYLVLFSYALFNEGWSGLTITIGAIVTLFAAMQLTGRIRWDERFATAT